MGLGFLETQDVGLVLIHEFEKALLHDGADTVDVPRDEFHRVASMNS
jgi:hypothetical protein